MLSFVPLALLAGALASPINFSTLSKRELDQGYKSDVTIHESCNSTQRRMLEQALAETFEVAAFAKEYVQKNGPNDTAFQLYFGEEPENYAKVLGVWDSLLYSDKTGVLFRCDNNDGNCGQEGWRGHWRGDNATAETVICDASYTDRLFNAAFCMFGFELETMVPSVYWSIDLIHRMFHVPQVLNSAVQHYAEDLSEILELAEHNATYSPSDSDALQYFAAHVYANEVAKAGEACIGNIVSEHSHDEGSEHSHDGASEHSHSISSTSAAASRISTSAAAYASSDAAGAAAETSATPQDCHTHADGTVHCV